MVLNQMSDFWFEKLGHIVPNHLTGVAPESVVAPEEVDQVKGRAVVAKRLKPIMVEAVVRGYIIGSGWKDYQANGAICGIHLPAGLRQADKLPEPLFTPAAKADLGEHDENISFAEMEHRIGIELAAQMRDISIKLYKPRRIRGHARHHHRRHQVRIRPRRQRRAAPDGRSPDRRFLALLAGGLVRPGHVAAVLRQAVRARLPGNPDRLEQDRAGAGLPQDVIDKTQAKYFEAIERLTGEKLKV
jgi:phosphoribosylaminoimidazole-succinocarboxamide synthase